MVRRDSTGIRRTSRSPLGEEPFDSPAARRLALTAEAVVQAARAVLPELPGRWNKPEAAPGRRTGNRLCAEIALHFGEPIVQFGSRPERFALPRGERAELRV